MGPDPAGIDRLDPLLQSHFVLPLLEQLRVWSVEASAGRRRLPLIGLNGPVGAGKSTLGRQLEALAPRFGLRLMVASIDDLYLSWPERRERLAGNPFGVSRVPPGSHDLPLLLEALEQWRQRGVLRLPRFDKTLAGGQGDRAGWREGVCEALVLEGWLMGCRPVSEACLAIQLDAVAAGSGRSGEAASGAARPFETGSGAPPLRAEEWRWLPRWNRELVHYQPLWQACDGLWLLRPLHWGLPRRWRFQAEARQRRGGGGWLPAGQLDQLVRASLCSLPPSLYQDPLTRELACAPGTLRWPAISTENPWLTGELCATSNHAGGSSDGSSRLQGAVPGSEGEQDSHKAPSSQAVAWLDGRRRCRSVWLQASLSPSSSATG